jgi:hypothetical protein
LRSCTAERAASMVRCVGTMEVLKSVVSGQWSVDGE